MIRKLAFASLIVLAAHVTSFAQAGPNITSWIRNTTATGYAGIVSNVQEVQYTATEVYVSASCIPGYSIGPWMGDPNIPSNQNFVYAIPRYPVQNMAAPDSVGLGHVGVWTNGVSIFNTQDAMSYNNQNVWHQNAYVFEGVSFDACLGHPDQSGEYHHHVSPKCLYNITDSTHHSPIIGYAFDGYPVYGAYGYSNTNGSGSIRRMKSSYQLRNISVRDTLPGSSTALPPSLYGPAVSSTYPLGSYQEDYEFIAGSGDLDIHNGRWCITPDYPAGTYCYFVTLDSNLLPQYPYTLGLTYYGVVNRNDVGPTGGHNTPSGADTIYAGATAVTQITAKDFSVMIYPNPAATSVYLFIQPISSNNFTVTLSDMSGRQVFSKGSIQPTILYSFNVSEYAAGEYIMHVKNSDIDYTEKIVIAR